MKEYRNCCGPVLSTSLVDCLNMVIVKRRRRKMKKRMNLSGFNESDDD